MAGNVWEQSWFWPVLGVVIGLPIVLLVLTELHSTLARRGRPSAKLVGLLNNFILPVTAILILVTQVTISVDSIDFTWTRIVATVLGFLLILFVLNTVDFGLFTNARKGTWRDRLPSIFIDIGRLLLICIGLGVLFSIVWDADVGGLFTALGVGSIVIGLALQGAIGSVVSGLLLLFEQPFRLGDWLEVGGTRGRVVQVNWRAVHLDTGNGIQIMPNASLADSAFTNLSRAVTFSVSANVTYSTDDSPTAVCALLQQVADRLPELVPGTTSSAVPLGGSSYEVSFEVAGPSQEGPALARFRTWLWFASRREGFALDGDSTDAVRSPERLQAAIRQVAPSLRLTDEDTQALAEQTSLERYGAGEVLLDAGVVPTSVRFLLDGLVSLAVSVDTDLLPVARIDSGDYVGESAMTREPAATTAVALAETTVLVVPIATLDGLLRKKPALARELGRVIEQRKVEVATSLRELG